MRNIVGDSSGWRAADRNPDEIARYLDTLAQVLSGMKQKSIDMLRLESGAAVLDVGCGLGHDVMAIAHQLGGTARVVGVDISHELIAKAMERARTARPPPEFRLGDALALDFADDTFDACRIDRVLQHLHDPARAVAEMVRVTRPGGRVCASDADWHTLAIAGGDTAVTQAIVRHRGFVECRQGDIGRRLPRLLIDAGCDDVGMDVHATWYRDLATADFLLTIRGALDATMASGAVARDAGEVWWQALQNLDARGGFFASITGMICAGTVR
jgi:ubiquinone/menaquinone biosynthesis C-methylase UbiE